MSASERFRRECFFILLLLCVISFLYFSVFGHEGYLKMRVYQKEYEALRARNERLRTGNEKLMKDIKQLKSNPNVIERVAREDFNFARPGDIIVTLPQKSQVDRSTTPQVDKSTGDSTR